jgi:hypothetical protein
MFNEIFYLNRPKYVYEGDRQVSQDSHNYIMIMIDIKMYGVKKEYPKIFRMTI